HWTVQLTKGTSGFQITNKQTGAQLALAAVQEGARAVCDGQSFTWVIEGQPGGPPDEPLLVGVSGTRLSLCLMPDEQTLAVEVRSPSGEIPIFWRFQPVG
ncbi:hypothetical protein ACFWWS_36270, partial [Streptomyces sp. NPDC059083]